MKNLIYLISLSIILDACTATNSVFSKRSPRESYIHSLKKTDTTAAGNFERLGAQVLINTKKVNKNYSEAGRLPTGQSMAAGLRFNIIAGQRTEINMASPGKIFIDLWEVQPNGSLKHLVNADTLAKQVWVNSTRGGDYVLRWQSAFSNNETYELKMVTMPMYGWPIAANYKNNLGSVWGDPRDGGVRKHEGIDIMAAAGVPVVAVADGIITNVNENELGGKVISLRPANSNLSIYYAHLSEQSVNTGDRVTKGQVIGKVGNTGNARTTVPHLHFGVYDRYNGAIDPIGFVQPKK